jgi:hypothetical protein
VAPKGEERLAPLDPSTLTGEWKLDLSETTVRIYAVGTTKNGDTLLEGRFGNQDLENYDPSSAQDAILFKNVVRVRNKPGQPETEEEYAGQIWLKENQSSGRWALVYIRIENKSRMFARDQAGSDAFGFTKVR